MTAEERRILPPLARALRLGRPRTWSDLKYETQFGPEFVDFPYYPAAIEYESDAKQAIAGLDDSSKLALVAAWRSKPRHPNTFTDDKQILMQYAFVLLDLIVLRARQAATRM
jgi:hypothetical protein